MNEIIAITGGIGSGKSQVLNTLKDAGEKVISCDALTNELYKKHAVKRWLKKTFPHSAKGVFNIKIDKKKIASVVFSDQEKLKLLTDYLTPLILKESLARAKKLGGRVFIEVPLLFECNAQSKFDKVVVIIRDLESRISSVMARNKLSREQVLERINSQFDYDSADLSQYHVIINAGDLQALNQKTLQLTNNLKRLGLLKPSLVFIRSSILH